MTYFLYPLTFLVSLGGMIFIPYLFYEYVVEKRTRIFSEKYDDSPFVAKWFMGFAALIILSILGIFVVGFTIALVELIT